MRVIYYKDELSDDFSQTKIKQKELPPDYEYIHKNPFRRLFDFSFYHLIAVPVAFLYQKIAFGEKIVNKKVLRKYRKNGFFLYGNHTRKAGDAFTPTLLAFPKKAYILTNPDSVSIPIVGTISESLGAVSLPTSLKGYRNFHKAVEEHGNRGHIVTVYPEAHIWPYYTDIRPFKDGSFRYPAELNKPVFTFTITYRKRFLSKRPKSVVYVDGPFFPDPQLTVRQNQAYLHDRAMEAMRRRSESSTVEYVHYEKIGEFEDEALQPESSCV